MEAVAAHCGESAEWRMALWDTLVSKYYLPRAVTGDGYFDDAHAKRVTRWLLRSAVAFPRAYVTMLCKYTANTFDASVRDWFELSEASLEDAVRLVSCWLDSLQQWHAFFGNLVTSVLLRAGHVLCTRGGPRSVLPRRRHATEGAGDSTCRAERCPCSVHGRNITGGERGELPKARHRPFHQLEVPVLLQPR